MSGLGKLMKQAAKMQQQMEQIQASLAARTVEATSGGGAVKVTAKCDGSIADFEGLRIHEQQHDAAADEPEQHAVVILGSAFKIKTPLGNIIMSRAHQVRERAQQSIKERNERLRESYDPRHA